VPANNKPFPPQPLSLSPALLCDLRVLSFAFFALKKAINRKERKGKPKTQWSQSISFGLFALNWPRRLS
jgi:hypothetical protein